MLKALLALVTALASFSARAEDLCQKARQLSVGHGLATIPVNEKTEDMRLWDLDWHDEFDVPGPLNKDLWKLETGGDGWGNHEFQFYTDREKNVRVIPGGTMIIEAHAEDWDKNKYTSGRINSVRRMTYGKIEFRAKLPHGRGMWGAAWMLPTNIMKYGTQVWPDNGEIDVIEAVGNENNINHYSVHRRASWGPFTEYTYLDPVYEGDQNFHVYSVEWMPDSIRFIRDGEVRFTAKRKTSDTWREWPFDQDMYIVMNLTVGGFWGIHTMPLDTTMFPVHMEYDYVRVYRPSAAHPGCPVDVP